MARCATCQAPVEGDGYERWVSCPGCGEAHAVLTCDVACFAAYLRRQSGFYPNPNLPEAA